MIPTCNHASVAIRTRLCPVAAFSSEANNGSREENASKQNLKPSSDSIRTDQASGGIEPQRNVDLDRIRQGRRNRWQRLGAANGVDRRLIESGLSRAGTDPDAEHLAVALHGKHSVDRALQMLTFGSPRIALVSCNMTKQFGS